MASVSRLRLETCAAKNVPDDDAAGTVIEINGGKIARVEDAGCQRARPLQCATSSSILQREKSS